MGKSTFMSSIIFCLHGYEELKKSELLESYDTLYNISNIGKDSNKVTKITIFLEIQNENSVFEITRVFDNKRIREIGYNGELEILKVNDNKKNAVNSDIVLNYLPKELVPLLFFNGERIKSIEDVLNKGGSNRREFRNQVENILKIGDYEKAKTLLLNSNRKLNEKRKANNYDDVALIRDKRDNAQRTLKIINNKLEECNYKIECCNIHIEEIEHYLSENTKSQEVQIKLNKLNNKIVEIDRNINKYEENFKKEIPIVISDEIKKSTFKKLIDSIEKKHVDTIEIPGVNQSAIEHILENGVCICNRKISPLEENHFHVIKSSMPPESFHGYLKGYISGKREKESVGLLINTYNEFKIEKNKLLNNVKEMDDQLLNFDASEIQNKKQLHMSIKSERDLLYSERNELKTKRVQTQLLYDLEDDKLNNARENQDEIDMVDSVQRYIDKSINLLENKIKDKKDIIQYQLQMQINTIAQRLLRDDLEITIDKNLKPTVLFKSGVSDKSTGQNAMVSLAYLFALIEVTKNDDNIFEETSSLSYPLILDGITGTLDGGHTYNAIKDFYDYNGQVIFLTNSKEVNVVIDNLTTAGMLKASENIQLLTREINGNETKVIKK